jgi:tetrapyrrole methylase family protein/MazG family protein
MSSTHDRNETPSAAKASASMKPSEKFVLKDHYSYDELVDLVAFLYSPAGCPWDQKQTHESIKGSLVEEAWEAVDAIEQGRDDRLADELGDVLLQVIFHAEMGRVAGSFSMDDVLRNVCRKLISRHSHIFAQDTASDPKEVRELWESNKIKEKGLKSETDVLRDVPRSLPALSRSYKIQKKAAACGFDWPNAEGARAKLAEEAQELAEVEAQIQAAHSKASLSKAEADRLNERLAEEAGDLLFAAVNYLRKLGIDPELALNQANEKFIRRFSQIEDLATEQDQALRGMSLEEMDQLWEKVKAQEK